MEQEMSISGSKTNSGVIHVKTSDKSKKIKRTTRISEDLVLNLSTLDSHFIISSSAAIACDVN